MENTINSSFINDGKEVNLRKKGIQDADFVYLLSKETKKVDILNLCTY